LPNPTLAEQQVLAQTQEGQVKTGPGKRAFIDQQLGLSPQQAAQFWPVYDEHQVSLGELNRRRVENILAYARAWNAGSVDDQTANKLAREAIAIEEDEAKLLKRTYLHASKATSPAQAARYVQVEAMVRAMVRYEEAARVPLMK
jgi:Spy/CpxP family protein refolding chaperone